MTPDASRSAAPPGRLLSLDQFRGYTVAAMFFVNYAGNFAAVPAVLKHHNTYCSLADTIMPQFFFAVGFALRLVVLRNLQKSGSRTTWFRALRRIGLLLALGLAFYHLDWDTTRWDGMLRPIWRPWGVAQLWRDAFETLVHIAVTSLWILPVIAGRARSRLLFGVGSGLLHLGLSAWFWYPLLHEKSVIDGGPLGFLTWTIPALAGSFAYDFRQERGARGALHPLLLWGGIFMLLGYLVSCFGAGGHLAAPPFFPPRLPVDLWTMSQRAGSLSYLTFAAGFSLSLYAGFVWLCDLHRKKLALFTILGANALAAYLVHAWVDVPFSWLRDAPHLDAYARLPLALLLTAGFIATSTFLVQALNRRGWFLRL